MKELSSLPPLKYVQGHISTESANSPRHQTVALPG